MAITSGAPRTSRDGPSGPGARVGAEHHVRVEDGQQALEVLPAGGGQEGGGHRALPGGIGRG